jgi:hypothetical protein
MTLIAVAFNKSAVCVSTDTQLTNLSNTDLTTDAIKSNYIYCKNGKFLAAYTGNDVYLEDGVHVSDWITNLLAPSDIKEEEIDAILQKIVTGLNEKYYYKRNDIPPLTIIFAGWLFGNNERQMVYRITNCETEKSQSKSPSKEFDLFQETSKRDVILRGTVKKGVDHQFDGKSKYIKKLLKTATIHNFRDTIGKSLYELNMIAHNNSSWGKYIGENTALMTIHKNGDGVDVWRFPESSDYLIPSFNNGNMSVKGIKVHNDPIKGGTITLDIKKDI